MQITQVGSEYSVSPGANVWNDTPGITTPGWVFLAGESAFNTTLPFKIGPEETLGYTDTPINSTSVSASQCIYFWFQVWHGNSEAWQSGRWTLDCFAPVTMPVFVLANFQIGGSPASNALSNVIAAMLRGDR